MVCSWDTIRRVEQLKTAKAAKAKAEAEEAAAREAAAQEAAAAQARAAATASSLGVSELDYDDDLTQYTGTPFEHIQVHNTHISFDYFIQYLLWVMLKSSTLLVGTHFFTFAPLFVTWCRNCGI